MLKQRLLTAGLLIALFTATLFGATAEVFNLLLGVVLTLAAWEWGRMSGLRSRLLQLLYPQLLVLLTLLVITLEQRSVISWLLPFAVAAVWWLLALLCVITFPRSARYWGGQWQRMLMGVVVLVPTALALYFFRIQPKGEWWVAIAVAIVVLADSGAYFAGRAFGRNKLAPAVSPGKSWEGVAGGLLAVTLFAMVLAALNSSLALGLTLLIFLPAACCSVLGDLLESMVKRHCGIKDSSQLLPGHGGVMDRIDALSAAAPVLALAMLVSGWVL